MQPKNKRKRILRTNASVSGPIKVRNLKTGELAIYTPDKLQPTIPAGWVPLNSNRQQSRTASRNFRRNSGLVVQTCGNQYRILNSSRKIVAQGKLNASADGDDEYWRSNLSNIWKNKAAQWMDEDSFNELSEIFVEKTGWYPVDQGKYPDQVIATATPDGKGEKHLFTVTEETVGLGKYGEEFEDLGPVDDAELDSSRGRQSMNCGADYDPRWNEWYDFLTPEEMETYAVEQGADPGFIAEEGEEVRRAIGEGVAGYLVAKPELNNPAETDLIVTESGLVGNYTHEDPRNRRGLRFFPYNVDEILEMSGVDEDF